MSPPAKTPKTAKAKKLGAQYPNKKTMFEQGHSFNSNSNNQNGTISQEKFWDLLEQELGTQI